MQMVYRVWRNQPFIFLTAEGTDGPAAEQMETLLNQAELVLESSSLSLEDAVFIRVWMRNRAISDEVRAVRTRRLTGTRRVASSSFFAVEHFLGTGKVAIDLIVMPSVNPLSRRSVDFTPPRRYIHYLFQDGWIFISGMAEQGEDIEDQFVSIIIQIERALLAEDMDWNNVQSIEIYMERDLVDMTWVLQRLNSRVSADTDIITIRAVDGLSSRDKKLEIEVIAWLDSFVSQ